MVPIGIWWAARVSQRDKAEYESLAFNGTTPYVAYEDFTNSQKATVMSFDGTNWNLVGSAGLLQRVEPNISI